MRHANLKVTMDTYVQAVTVFSLTLRREIADALLCRRGSFLNGPDSVEDYIDHPFRLREHRHVALSSS